MKSDHKIKVGLCIVSIYLPIYLPIYILHVDMLLYPYVYKSQDEWQARYANCCTDKIDSIMKA